MMRKQLILFVATGMIALAGLSYGVTSSNYCPLEGTAWCPKNNCPLAGTPECPLERGACCAKK